MFSRLPDGSMMQITKVYPLDAVFDNPDDVPEDVKKKSLDFFLVFNVRIYILMLMFFFVRKFV